MFAVTKSAGVRRLVTQTFTSNTSWTAPSSLLVSMSGYGGPATPDGQTTGVVSEHYVYGTIAAQPNTPYLLWETVEAGVDATAAIIAANSGTNYLYLNTKNYPVDSSDRYDIDTFPDDKWIVGNSYTKTIVGSHPTTGNVLYTQVSGSGFFGWRISATYRTYGSDGIAIFTFGKTFPGGTLTGTEPFRTAVPPVTTTYSNVVITAGITYNIVIPSGGSLTISYYV